MRRALPTAVVPLLVCLAALAAAPVAEADSSVPAGPVDSFSRLVIGLVVVLVILVISAVVLARIVRAKRARQHRPPREGEDP